MLAPIADHLRSSDWSLNVEQTYQGIDLNGMFKVQFFCVLLNGSPLELPKAIKRGWISNGNPLAQLVWSILRKWIS